MYMCKIRELLQKFKIPSVDIQLQFTCGLENRLKRFVSTKYLIKISIHQSI